MSSGACSACERRLSRAAVCALLALAFGSSILAAQTPDPKTIMEGVDKQDTSRDMTMKAVLDIYGKDGVGSKKQFTLSRIGPPGDSKTLLRFTAPEEIKGLALLSINTKGATDRQYLYTPAIERVRPISPRELSEKFAGSDFTFEDVAERVLDDFTYTMIGTDDVIANHKTYKIQATPVSADKSQYKYIYVWVAQDVPVILAAQMYDQDGQMIRELHASDLKKVSNMWGARKLEMISPLDKTRTTLTIDDIHFNVPLDEKMFTPDGMDTAGAPTAGKRAAAH
jgi:hypothetical protein